MFNVLLLNRALREIREIRMPYMHVCAFVFGRARGRMLLQNVFTILYASKSDRFGMRI